MIWPLISKIIEAESGSVHIEYSLLAVIISVAAVGAIIAVAAATLDLFAIDDLMRGLTLY